jgi:hypothetical protein
MHIYGTMHVYIHIRKQYAYTYTACVYTYSTLYVYVRSVEKMYIYVHMKEMSVCVRVSCGWVDGCARPRIPSTDPKYMSLFSLLLS